MRRFTKALCLVIAFVMILALAAGCSAEKANTDSSTTSAISAESTKEEVTETTGKSAEEMTGDITWWAAWGEDAGPGAMIEEFNKKYPNIHVRYVQFTNTDDGNVKIDTSLLAGEDIHAFFNYGATRLAPRADKNLVQDLTEFIARDGFNVEKELGEGGYKNDDKYVGLPVGSLTFIVYLNMDHLEEAGLPVPPDDWTLEDYKEYATKLTKVEGNKITRYGAGEHTQLYYWTRPVIGLLGDNAWYNGQGLSGFDNPAFKTALQYKYDIENVLKVSYPYTDYKATKTDVYAEFLNGNISMILQGNAIARMIKDTEKYPRDFKIATVPLPQIEKGQSQNYNRGLYYFDYLSMNAGLSEEDKEATWTFMKWLAMEGSLGLANVGHLPSWKGTDKSLLINLLLGDKAEELVDIEQYKRIVLDYESQAFNDTLFTAYGQVTTIIQEEAEKALFDEISVDDALKNMKKRCDEEINKVLANK